MEDLTNQTFGKLTVRALGRPKRYPETHPAKAGQVKEWRWICDCSCGGTCEVAASNLKNRPRGSCGCHRKSQCAANFTTHGETKGKRRPPEYSAWCGMNRRCHEVTWKQYQDYGGRGIRVCRRWRGRNGFACFLADMGRKPTAQHSLDRKNNDGHYSPQNCRWATRTEQARNRRQTRRLRFRGQERAVAAWAEQTGIPLRTIIARIDRFGWTIAKALTTPVNR